MAFYCVEVNNVTGKGMYIYPVAFGVFKTACMEIFFFIASFLMMGLWVYIIIRVFKAFSEFKKASGMGISYLFNPLNFRRLVDERDTGMPAGVAYKAFRRKVTRLIWTWVLAMAAVALMAVLVGLLTARRDG